MMFNNLFNSITFYIILGLSISTLGFGYLSYHFHGDKVEAEYALVNVIDANTELEKSLNLRDLSCKIDSQITSEYQAEKQVQQGKTQGAISKIDSLPKKATSQVKQDAEIDIDSTLPDSVLSVLRQSCIQGEGDACIPTR